MSLGARRSTEAGPVMSATMATICTPNVSVSIHSFQIWTLVWECFGVLRTSFIGVIDRSLSRTSHDPSSQDLRDHLQRWSPLNIVPCQAKNNQTMFPLSGSATENVQAIIEQKSRDELVAAVLHLLDELQNCDKSWWFMMIVINRAST